MLHHDRMPDGRVRITPEGEHLANQERILADLTEVLATREAEFASIGIAFARFRLSYLARFAPLYADLDRLEAEILRLVAERTPSGAPEAGAAKARAEAAEARAHESESAAEGAEEDPGIRCEPSAEIRALYRKVAKAVHPDLAGDDEDRGRRTRLDLARQAGADAPAPRVGTATPLAGRRRSSASIEPSDSEGRTIELLVGRFRISYRERKPASPAHPRPHGVQAMSFTRSIASGRLQLWHNRRFYDDYARIGISIARKVTAALHLIRRERLSYPSLQARKIGDIDNIVGQESQLYVALSRARDLLDMSFAGRPSTLLEPIAEAPLLQVGYE